jgi:hypothetical protein
MGLEAAVMHVRQWRDDHWFRDRWDVSIGKLFQAGRDAVVAATVAVCRWRFAAGVAGLVVENKVWFLL